MTTGKFSSISKRFSYALIGIITCVLIAFAIAAIMINQVRTESHLRNSLSTSLKLTEVALRIPLWNVDYYAVQGFLDALPLDGQVVFAQVIVDGNSIATNAREEFEKASFESFEDSKLFMTGEIEIQHQDEVIGTFQLAVSRDAIRDTMLINGLGVLLLFALVVCAITITSLLVSKRYVARPLARLQRSASAIADGDLEAAIDVDRHDEIGSLARNLDTMRESIKDLIGKLQEANRQKLNEILDLCPAGLHILDDDGILVFHNKRLADMLGYSDEELRGIDTRKFWVDLDQRERLVERVKNQGGQLVDQEVIFKRKDGSQITVLVSYTQAAHQDAESRGSRIAWLYDISDLKRAEEARHRSEQRLVDAIETIGDGFCLYDEDEKLVIFNQRYRDAFPGDVDVIRTGVSFEEIAGEIAASGKLKAAVGRENDWIENRLKSFRNPPKEPTIVQRLDGRWMQISERRTTEGGSVSTYTDVTEIKRREQELAKVTERLNLAMSIDEVGIYDADFVANTLWWSPEYTAMLGHNPKTFVPVPPISWEERLHPDSAEKIKARMNAFIDGDEDTMRLRQHLLRPDQQEIWVDSVMRMQRDDTGQATRLTGLAVDITEQLKREQQLANANRFIMESLHYASRIQSAMLPARDAIGSATHVLFWIWEPRDIVGGDFFWFHPIQGGYALIVGDCTGHGVPGAFMTLIACGLLDRMLQSGIEQPSRVLSRLHQDLQTLLGQDQIEGDTDDGLEAGICFVSHAERKLVFSGARFSLFHATNGDLAEVRGDKAGIGYRRFASNTQFNDTVLDLDDRQSFYMTTDGLIDQIGGRRRRSFGKRRFLSCLAGNLDSPMPRQAETLKHTFSTYQGAENRRDDVTVLGFTPKIERAQIH